jgi:N-acetylglucosamine malate deacetylase 1
VLVGYDFFMAWKNLLIVAPHTDDAELGCGGAIVRLLEEGINIHVAAFSTAEESRPKDTPPYFLKEEFLESTRILGIPKQNVHVYDYPVRKLSYHRQEVLDELIRLRSAVKPDAVFIPSENDTHQDHQVIHSEGLRAFRNLTLWGYELPWNHIHFSAQGFISLSEKHLQKKWEAISAYKSQLKLRRPYFDFEFIKGLAKVRGVQIQTDFAEAFEVIRVRL